MKTPFALGSLICFITLACGCTKLETPSTTTPMEGFSIDMGDPAQSALMAELDESGVRYQRNDSGEFTQIDYRDLPVTDSDLRRLGDLSQLKVLKLNGKSDGAQVSDSGLEPIGKIKSLKVLALDLLPVTSEAIKHLTDLSQMKEIYLAKTRIDDQAITAMSGMSELSKLRISGTEVTDSAIAQLAASHANLVSLDVSECGGLTDDSIKHISELAELDRLNLWSVAISDENIAKLETLSKITWLNVDNTQLTDAALPTIGKLTTLKFLHLGSTQISDAGLVHLEQLTNLEKLIVTRTKVTSQGVEKLQQKLPNTEIQLVYVPGK